jgi:hypothetical protein
LLAGGIFGTAADMTGGVLPGARVILHQPASGIELTARADSQGRFGFPDLAKGEYIVTFGRWPFISSLLYSRARR